MKYFFEYLSLYSSSCLLSQLICKLLDSELISILILGDEDTAQMQYFWLYKGEPKRCFCGHFFQLKEISAEDFPQYPKEDQSKKWEGEL